MGIRARGGPGLTDLLDLAEGELERGIDPAEDLPPPDEVGAVHQPDARHRRRHPLLDRGESSLARVGLVVGCVERERGGGGAERDEPTFRKRLHAKRRAKRNGTLTHAPRS